MKTRFVIVFLFFCLMSSKSLFATTSVDDDWVPYGNYVAEIVKITAVSDDECMASFIDGFNNKKKALDFKKDPIKIENVSNVDYKQLSEVGKDDLDITEIARSFEVLSLDCELTRVGNLPSDIEQAIAKEEIETKVSIDKEKIVIFGFSGEQVFRYTQVSKKQDGFIFVSDSGKTLKLSEIEDGLKLCTESVEYFLKRIN